MLAILAAIAFAFAAIFCFIGFVGLSTVIAIIAIGLVLLSLHQAGFWASYTPWRTVHRQP